MATRIITEVEVRPGQFYREYAGSSQDSKPAHDDERTGNTFLEVDTADVYFYDERTSSWVKAGGGAGGDE